MPNPNKSLIFGIVVLAFAASVARSMQRASSWRDDPVWNEGKADWALYDAVRLIYEVDRLYEETIYTNKQHMDPGPRYKLKKLAWWAYWDHAQPEPGDYF